MRAFLLLTLVAAGSLAGQAAVSAEFDGKLLMYPNGHNMNSMPAAAVAQGVPLVLETDDTVATVDGWYQANAPKTCVRTSAAQGVKYQCDGGSIMIYAKGKTQIAFVPDFALHP
ncbi:MAG TPA: hypothetical protein VHS76_03925 [Steroidobacteraceae bacterium]|nr:hypothetical protein [Steroidobacteraceae bacterium]